MIISTVNLHDLYFFRQKTELFYAGKHVFSVYNYTVCNCPKNTPVVNNFCYCNLAKDNFKKHVQSKNILGKIPHLFRRFSLETLFGGPNTGRLLFR